MMIAAVHESVHVQVFGRRHDEPFHALWRPASKKRRPSISSLRMELTPQGLNYRFSRYCATLKP